MVTGSSGGSGGGGDGGWVGGDDVRGLKFGKKTYFEQDAAGGGSGTAAGGGRKGKGVASANPAPQQPRCQVEGCGVDLSGAKVYYCRHKVCSMHSKSPLVVVAGIEQRFCQQCSRFHQLHEFDQGKRSCRRRLLGHNERRRKPPPGHFSSRYGRFAASLHDDPGRSRSFLLDFSYPRVPSSVRDAWQGVQHGNHGGMPGSSQWQGSQEVHAHRSAVAGYGDHAYSSHGGSSAGAAPVLPGFELPSGECIAGVAADSSCALSLLSTQPWDSSTHSASHNRSPAMSSTSAFYGNPVAPSVTASNYMTARNSRVHDGGGGSSRNTQQHHLPHEAALNEVHHGSVHHGQFGELELALQGRGHPPPNPLQFEHGSNSSFSHSSNAMNWSL